MTSVNKYNSLRQAWCLVGRCSKDLFLLHKGLLVTFLQQSAEWRQPAVSHTDVSEKACPLFFLLNIDYEPARI